MKAYSIPFAKTKGYNTTSIVVVVTFFHFQCLCVQRSIRAM